MTQLTIPKATQPIVGRDGIVAPEWFRFFAGLATPASVETQIADALADYPEYDSGTWTPAITFGGAAVGVTYGLQDGTYVKVRNVVFYRGRITLTNKGSSTGAVKIAGLPFTAIGTGVIATIGYYTNAATLTDGILGVGDGASIDLRMGGASSVAALTNANITNTFDIVFSAIAFL